MKRLFDLIAVVPAILFLAPVFVAIAISIKKDSPGPVFFRQIRVGKRGENFRIFKFRTMVSDAEKQGIQISTISDSRITKVGASLRKYKLDELPQLFNVFIGEMSLVGPRPEVPKYVAYYPEEVKAKVLSVQPGITDMASIEFRDENKLLENIPNVEREYIDKILPIKLKYYLDYVENHNLLGDIKIILLTLLKIIKH